MKAISIQVIQPDGATIVSNEIIATKVMGWRMVGSGRHLPQTGFSKMIVTMDSGQEYDVAESAEDFKQRLRMVLEVPVYGFSGFIPSSSFRTTPPIVENRIGTLENIARMLIRTVVKTAHPARCGYCGELKVSEGGTWTCPNYECPRDGLIKFERGE